MKPHDPQSDAERAKLISKILSETRDTVFAAPISQVAETARSMANHESASNLFNEIHVKMRELAREAHYGSETALRDLLLVARMAIGTLEYFASEEDTKFPDPRVKTCPDSQVDGAGPSLDLSQLLEKWEELSETEIAEAEKLLIPEICGLYDLIEDEGDIVSSDTAPTSLPISRGRYLVYYILSVRLRQISHKLCRSLIGSSMEWPIVVTHVGQGRRESIERHISDLGLGQGLSLKLTKRSGKGKPPELESGSSIAFALKYYQLLEEWRQDAIYVYGIREDDIMPRLSKDPAIIKKWAGAAFKIAWADRPDDCEDVRDWPECVQARCSDRNKQGGEKKGGRTRKLKSVVDEMLKDGFKKLSKYSMIISSENRITGVPIEKALFDGPIEKPVLGG